ncbi:MAG: sugar transferase [Clostridium baratii]|uniref:sugar transferase n=1 Tax=Clostridium baratii TaxID=1561 RepID=UPI002431AA82|nr:sugar transferase [Clostridium baratii]MBS6041954.1 sugar transferase [Clostridium baratii]
MKLIKRLFDILFSLLVLIMLSPVFLIVAILVRINLGSPILFTQERIGLNNDVFKMYKFRTMKDGKDKNGNLLPDSERLTKFGKILRSTSLDELPEFINILKGDMSLIGPRPLLVEYLSLYSNEQIKRHNVLPGLTGWAQINGRNTISWSEKFKLDVWYVENWSISLDIKIFFLTIYKVFRRDGINQEGKVTMTKFNGLN